MHQRHKLASSTKSNSQSFIWNESVPKELDCESNEVSFREFYPQSLKSNCIFYEKKNYCYVSAIVQEEYLNILYIVIVICYSMFNKMPFRNSSFRSNAGFISRSIWCSWAIFFWTFLWTKIVSSSNLFPAPYTLAAADRYFMDSSNLAFKDFL